MTDTKKVMVVILDIIIDCLILSFIKVIFEII